MKAILTNVLLKYNLKKYEVFLCKTETYGDQWWLFYYDAGETPIIFLRCETLNPTCIILRVFKCIFGVNYNFIT